MIPTIETGRLTLSPAAAGDLDALLELWREPEVRRYLWNDRELSREKAAGILDGAIAASEHGAGLWTVRVGDDDALAGCVGLRPTEQPAIEPLAAFHPRHWGRGYATEALGALLDHAFGTLGLAWLSAIVAEPDTGSARLLERLGFRRTEMAMGQKHLLIAYALAAPDWHRPPPRP